MMYQQPLQYTYKQPPVQNLEEQFQYIPQTALPYKRVKLDTLVPQYAPQVPQVPLQQQPLPLAQPLLQAQPQILYPPQYQMCPQYQYAPAPQLQMVQPMMQAPHMIQQPQIQIQQQLTPLYRNFDQEKIQQSQLQLQQQQNQKPQFLKSMHNLDSTEQLSEPLSQSQHEFSSQQTQNNIQFLNQQQQQQQVLQLQNSLIGSTDNSNLNTQLKSELKNQSKLIFDNDNKTLQQQLINLQKLSQINQNIGILNKQSVEQQSEQQLQQQQQQALKKEQKDILKQNVSVKNQIENKSNKQIKSNKILLLQCNKCEYEADNYQSLSAHKEDIHQQKLSPHLKSIVEIQNSNDEYSKLIAKYIKFDILDNSKCKVCELECSNNQNLKEHIRLHHYNNPRKLYKCYVGNCSFQGHFPQSFKNHLRSKHKLDIQTRIYKCKVIN